VASRLQLLYCTVVAPSTQSLLPLDELVALSLLRIGFDTKGPRLFRETIWPRLAAPVRPSPGQCLTDLTDLLGVPGADRPAVIARARQRAGQALQSARERGLEVVAVLDDRYPALLKQIPDPPLVLWVRGQVAMLGVSPLVAIVGSRNASPESLVISRRLARGLASAGIGIVSGMARGVDAAAHSGSLDSAQPTLAVLGCGADVIYPASHQDLASQIAERGALVSEFPPGTAPLAPHFPLRNRIISGLSHATVVVEASDKSGSLITARSALEQGRDVLAVPGPVVSGCHRGCHGLIKDGARLVETVDDVFEELGWVRPVAGSTVKDCKRLQVSWLESIMPPGSPCLTDDLAARSGRPVSEVLSELAALELSGAVERRPGGKFVRLD
jgi:DNA processing protein